MLSTVSHQISKTVKKDETERQKHADGGSEGGDLAEGWMSERQHGGGGQAEPKGSHVIPQTEAGWVGGEPESSLFGVSARADCV